MSSSILLLDHGCASDEDWARSARLDNEIRSARRKIAIEKGFNCNLSSVHFAQHGLGDFSPLEPDLKLTVNQARTVQAEATWVEAWYDSPTATTIRQTLKSGYWQPLPILCLFVSLFWADCMCYVQSPSNELNDLVFAMALAIFTFEFVASSMSHRGYNFSFLFWVDLLTTASMLFDISFCAGRSAQEPQRTSTGPEAGPQFYTAFNRMAQAARQGARAARLSRVVKVFKYLPCELLQNYEDTNAPVAQAITGKLNEQLCISVGFICVVVAVVWPATNGFAYPIADESLASWTQFLAADAEDYHAAWMASKAADASSVGFEKITARMRAELHRFVSFYADMPYGPYKVCYLADLVTGACATNMDYPEMHSFPFSEPERMASSWEITEGHFKVFYNLSAPMQLESMRNMLLIGFIIFMTLIYSVWVIISVNEVAVEPLDMVMSAVRSRCGQIFKYSRVLQDGQDIQSERSDLDLDEDGLLRTEGNEFDLLEKAERKLLDVQRLMEIHTRHHPHEKQRGELDEQDLTMLAYMGRGHEATDVDGSENPKRRNSVVQTRLFRSRSSMGSSASSARLERNMTSSDSKNRFGKEKRISSSINLTASEYSMDRVIAQIQEEMDQDILVSLKSADFDAHSVPIADRRKVSMYLLLTFEGCNVWVNDKIDARTLQSFLHAVEAGYNPNPFHNFIHALDVLYQIAYFMRVVDAGRFLDESTQFFLMIAAIGHDIGHIGQTNTFLIESAHELAIMYNDRSPLENMHCATLFKILYNSKTGVFNSVGKDDMKRIRKGIIETILHTDMAKHNDMMKRFQLLSQINTEMLTSGASAVSKEWGSVLEENSGFFSRALVHAADIGNPLKPWEICSKIAHLVLDEFFAEGDLERKAGLPVQMMNNREKVNRPTSQIGFLEFVILPMVESVLPFFPQLHELAMRCGENCRNWAQVWAEESRPSADAWEKMLARVEKVNIRCADLVAHSQEKLPGGRRQAVKDAEEKKKLHKVPSKQAQASGPKGGLQWLNKARKMVTKSPHHR